MPGSHRSFCTRTLTPMPLISRRPSSSPCPARAIHPASRRPITSTGAFGAGAIALTHPRKQRFPGFRVSELRSSRSWCDCPSPLPILLRPNTRVHGQRHGFNPRLRCRLSARSGHPQLMKTWQVLLIGEGFTVDSVLRNCEISGFVKAKSVAAAVEKVEAIARRSHSELEQAAGAFPRPGISAEEVVELGDDFPYPIDVDQVELHWVAAS